MTTPFEHRPPAPAELEQIAATVAGEAAAVVRATLGSAAAATTKSSATDVVTKVDIEAEELIRQALTTACPGSGVVGEELGDLVGTTGIDWIIDPIDGTVNFLYDLPVVSVSVAAAHNGEVVAGAIADVVRGETFTASRGAGARRSGRPICASAKDDLALSLVATGFSYDAALRAQQGSTVARVLPAARDVRCMGSAALNLCWVACGRLDAYYERDLKIYDYAAGALIAGEAGAVVTVPSGRGGNQGELAHLGDLGDVGDLVFAAAPGIAASLRSLVGERP